MAERLWGMMAEFDTPEALVGAARRAREAGYRRLDAFTPYLVEELTDALALREWRVGPVFALGGLAGFAATMAVTWYISIDYPLNVGGRPLFAFPGFSVVGFEMMIVGAVAAGVLGMLVMNGLPRLNHPVFEADRFPLATDSSFFLCVLADDPRFDEGGTRAFLAGSGPRSIEALRA